MNWESPPFRRGAVKAPNKEAAFGLSFALAVAESLRKQEPAPHTRRARALARLIDDCNAALALYPGQIDARYIDLAAQVFETLEKQAAAGLNG